MLAKLEGCVLTAYKCPAGVWTIGYGCTKWPDGRPVTEGDKLPSRRAALALLRETIPPYEIAVSVCVKQWLKQERYDSLVMLCYNIGISAFRYSTLVAKINAGKWKEAEEQIVRWVYVDGKQSKGLIGRRIKEQALFRCGVYYD